MIRDEYHQHFPKAKHGIVLELVDQPAPPLGIPKRMILVLIAGNIKKVPVLYAKVVKNEK